MVGCNIVSEKVPLGMVGSNVLRKAYEKNEYAIDKGAEQTTHDCSKNYNISYTQESNNRS